MNLKRKLFPVNHYRIEGDEWNIMYKYLQKKLKHMKKVTAYLPPEDMDKIIKEKGRINKINLN